MLRIYLTSRIRLILVLLLSSLGSVALYAAGAWGAHEHDFAYMIWNLLLAWLALGVTFWLERTLHRKLWSSWTALALTLIWVLFLPNTFYMITDYIHIRELALPDLIFGVVMFSSFIFNGVLIGLWSMYIIHCELLKRVSMRAAAAWVGLVLLLCSFAIYIGRELRWNTWDVLANPAALLFDVTDRWINLSQHPQLVSITFGFLVLLSSLYAITWYLMREARCKYPE